MTKRLVVLGTVRFSATCLTALRDSGANVVGVITGTERVLMRHADSCSLEPIARDAGIPCLAVDQVNGANVLSWLRERAPDVLLVVGWSQLVGHAVMQVPSLAAIGSHPTLLPEGRGRHPIIWTLIKGLRRGGLTFFILADDADAGDIVLQEAFEITDADDANTVYTRVEHLGARMMPALAAAIERGLPGRCAQDPAAVTVYPKRTERDGEVDWHGPAAHARNLVRALTKPYPGAHTFVRRSGHDDRVIVWRASLAEGPLGRDPGTVVMIGTTPIVRAADGWLRLDRHTSSIPLAEGDRLGSPT